jgi:hypothetical protein
MPKNNPKRDRRRLRSRGAASGPETLSGTGAMVERFKGNAIFEILRSIDAAVKWFWLGVFWMLIWATPVA